MAGSNFNESAYGPIADSYANKYGIPTDIFRAVIRNTSNFDPMYSGPNGTGIAGINSGKTGVDTFDVGNAFDFAAQYMSSVKKDGNSWDDVIANYIGGEPVVSSNDKTLAENEAAANAAKDGGDKAFWRYSADDWKALFSRSAWGVLFTLVGAIMIIVSLYVVIKNSGDAVK